MNANGKGSNGESEAAALEKALYHVAMAGEAVRQLATRDGALGRVEREELARAVDSLLAIQSRLMTTWTWTQSTGPAPLAGPRAPSESPAPGGAGDLERVPGRGR